VNCNCNIVMYTHTLMHTQTYTGHLPVCRWLIEQLHVHPDVKTHSSSTPFHWACWQGHEDVVQYLAHTDGYDVAFVIWRVVCECACFLHFYLPCTTPHHTTLHYTTPHHTTLHYTTPLFATPLFATPLSATPHYTTLHNTTHRRVNVHHYNYFRCNALHWACQAPRESLGLCKTLYHEYKVWTCMCVV
jgi:ankyrin repeat protein